MSKRSNNVLPFRALPTARHWQGSETRKRANVEHAPANSHEARPNGGKVVALFAEGERGAPVAQASGVTRGLRSASTQVERSGAACIATDAARRAGCGCKPRDARASVQVNFRPGTICGNKSKARARNARSASTRKPAQLSRTGFTLARLTNRARRVATLVLFVRNHHVYRRLKQATHAAIVTPLARVLRTQRQRGFVRVKVHMRKFLAGANNRPSRAQHKLIGPTNKQRLPLITRAPRQQAVIVVSNRHRQRGCGANHRINQGGI